MTQKTITRQELEDKFIAVGVPVRLVKPFWTHGRSGPLYYQGKEVFLADEYFVPFFVFKSEACCVLKKAQTKISTAVTATPAYRRSRHRENDTRVIIRAIRDEHALEHITDNLHLQLTLVSGNTDAVDYIRTKDVERYNA